MHLQHHPFDVTSDFKVTSTNISQQSQKHYRYCATHYANLIKAQVMYVVLCTFSINVQILGKKRKQNHKMRGLKYACQAEL